jgi:hypothetical protein
MTTYTKAELATRSLRAWSLIGADETPTAVDIQHVEETIDSVFAMLPRKGIRVWDTTVDATPDEYYVLMARYLGLYYAPDFGAISAAEAEAAKPLMERDLRAIATILPTGGVADSTYF